MFQFWLLTFRLLGSEVTVVLRLTSISHLFLQHRLFLLCSYLINQFIAQRTNQRTDEWGGAYKNRIRLPIEIVKRVRQACGPQFIIIYRLSMLDLVEGGSTWQEVRTRIVVLFFFSLFAPLLFSSSNSSQGETEAYFLLILVGNLYLGGGAGEGD